MSHRRRFVLPAFWLCLVLTGQAHAQAIPPAGSATDEISMLELHRILYIRTETVLDARRHLEYAISYIPGAVNVAPKPGIAPSMYVSYVAEIGRLVHGDKTTPLVLYC